MMTPRQRFLSALSFAPAGDRLPMLEWGAWWDETVARWQAEGLPAGVDAEQILDYFGMEKLLPIGSFAGEGCPPPPVYGGPVVTTEQAYEALRPVLFSRQKIDAAVERAARYKECHARGEVILFLWLDGFFWFPRTLFGIEGHLMAFYDQPELMHRMNRDLAEYQLRMLRAMLPVVTPDAVVFSEDMSYNHGPMISKALFDTFMAPYYARVVPAFRQAGVKVLMDSDGDIAAMVPWLLEAGIEGIGPLERQAGVDIAALRQAYPRLLMWGGFDKMVMPMGEAAMRAEFERILPVMASGGYIPTVDHQTPPGVSMEQYRTYVRLLREYTTLAGQSPGASHRG